MALLDDIGITMRDDGASIVVPNGSCRRRRAQSQTRRRGRHCYGEALVELDRHVAAHGHGHDLGGLAGGKGDGALRQSASEVGLVCRMRSASRHAPIHQLADHSAMIEVDCEGEELCAAVVLCQKRILRRDRHH